MGRCIWTGERSADMKAITFPFSFRNIWLINDHGQRTELTIGRGTLLAVRFSAAWTRAIYLDNRSTEWTEQNVQNEYWTKCHDQHSPFQMEETKTNRIIGIAFNNKRKQQLNWLECKLSEKTVLFSDKLENWCSFSLSLCRKRTRTNRWNQANVDEKLFMIIKSRMLQQQ